MNKFERFIPISKVDEEKRLVYGWASTPDLDSDGEVVELNAIKQALPSYLAFPTIREMHQPKAAGKTVGAQVIENSDKNGLWISAKIVSNDAWELVKNGVYKGFSIGGNIVEKMDNAIKKLELVEISLVDVPANKAATIELWKSSKPELDGQVKKIAEALIKLTVIDREGVNAMSTKEEKLAKEDKEVKEDEVVADEAQSDETAESDVSVDESAADEVGESESEDAEASEEESTEEVEETETDSNKEANADITLEKVNKDLDKVSDQVEVKKMNLEKTVNSMAATIAKLTKVVKNHDEELVKLGNTPAESKSEAVFVHKSEETQVKEDKSVKTDRVSQINKRLDELTELREKLNPTEFARQGLSTEAMRLKDERVKIS